MGLCLFVLLFDVMLPPKKRSPDRSVTTCRNTSHICYSGFGGILLRVFNHIVRKPVIDILNEFHSIMCGSHVLVDDGCVIEFSPHLVSPWSSRPSVGNEV